MTDKKMDRKIIVEDTEEESLSDMNDVSEELSAQSAVDAGDESSREQKEIETLQKDAKDNYDKYLRAVADLENFKKRAIKERSDLLRYASESLGREVVEVVDNLELAVKQSPPGTNDELLKGVRMILEQLNSALAKQGINAQSYVGETFDPEKQEALASVPTADTEPGTIIEEFKKTYYIKDKLLRPGKVVVSAAPSNEQSH